MNQIESNVTTGHSDCIDAIPSAGNLNEQFGDTESLLRKTRTLSIQSNDTDNENSTLQNTSSSPQKQMTYPKSRRLTNLKSFDVQREIPNETGTKFSMNKIVHFVIRKKNHLIIYFRLITKTFFS